MTWAGDLLRQTLCLCLEVTSSQSPNPTATSTGPLCTPWMPFAGCVRPRRRPCRRDGGGERQRSAVVGRLGHCSRPRRTRTARHSLPRYSHLPAQIPRNSLPDTTHESHAGLPVSQLPQLETPAGRAAAWYRSSRVEAQPAGEASVGPASSDREQDHAEQAALGRRPGGGRGASACRVSCLGVH